MRVLHLSQGTFRQVRTLAAIAIAAALFLMPAARPPVTEALGTMIGQPQNISNTSSNSEAPQISIGSDIVGVSWGERDDERIGTNRTTVGSAFSNASFVNAAGVSTKQQFPDIAVDSAGTMHLAYSIGDTVYYRVKLRGGGWSSARTVTDSSYPNPVRIAVGADGQIWIVWRDKDGTSIFYRRSTTGTSWSGGTVHSEKGNMFSPDIAVGPDSIPHVVWYIRSSGAANSGDIRIADWNGSGFSASDITTDGSSVPSYDADPTITIDSQNTAHVVWRKQIVSTPQQWAIQYAQRVSGQGWTGFTPIAITNGDAAYTPSIGTDDARNLYVVYSNPISSKNRQIVFYGKTLSGSWDGPVAMPNVRWDSRNAITGKDGIAHIAYQTEPGTDDGEIQYVRIDFASVPPLGAQPVIEGGATTTKKTTVSVAFTGVQGSPKEIRWRWGAAPTDATNDSGGWVTYSNPKSIPLPTSRTSCTALTLYTQVKDGTTIESTVKSDSITFDNTVQANVRIVNPFLAGLPQTFAQVSDVGVSDSDGAYDGDPTYTRIPQFFLSINDTGDCSALTAFTVPASNFNGTISNGQYQNKIALPQAANTTPGSTQTIGVSVFDSIGNPGNYSGQLTYDPANTDTTGNSPNTAGLPVLNSGSVSAGSNNSIVRTLSFSGVNVTDNVYGTKENLPSGREFWGVWIANSRTANLDVHDKTLKWFPVRVPSPNSSFSVQWNIFTGLNIGPDRTKTGDYYVYVRFLDGAGNATKTMLTPLKVTLTPGYTIPTYSLPFIRK